MTVKEIAEAVGKDERTVQRWVEEVRLCNPHIDKKAEKSSPMYPADYTLEETCSIVELGMGETFVGVLRYNIQQQIQEDFVPLDTINTMLSVIRTNFESLAILPKMMTQYEEIEKTLQDGKEVMKILTPK